MNAPLVVYVPALHGRAAETEAPLYELISISRGAGIVGQTDTIDAGYVEIYYEGNVYEMTNMATYADRVRHAAERLTSRYPTSARMIVRLDRLVPVGLWTDAGLSLDPDHDGISPLELVREWILSNEELLAEELAVTA